MKELPNIDILPVHSINLPVLSQDVKFTPYTVEQEKGILTAIGSKDIPAMIDNYKALIDTCFHEDVDWDNLTAMEFIFMCVNLRCKSKGEVLSVSAKCKKCDKPIAMDIHLEDNIVVENEKMLSAMVEFSEDLSFEIGPVDFKFLYKLPEIETESDLILQTALYSIKKVIWKKEMFKNPGPDVLQEKIKFSHDMLKKIFNKSHELIKMKMMVEVKCDDEDCAHTEVYKIADFLKYLM